jgi:hypothetical protein
MRKRAPAGEPDGAPRSRGEDRYAARPPVVSVAGTDTARNLLPSKLFQGGIMHRFLIGFALVCATLSACTTERTTVRKETVQPRVTEERRTTIERRDVPDEDTVIRKERTEIIEEEED